MNTFEIKEKTSKKGNRVICIHQNACETNPTESDFAWLSPNALFKTIAKIKTIADKERLGVYLNKTIEDVFEIAVEKQDWELIPYNTVVTITTISEIPDSVYFKGDWND